MYSFTGAQQRWRGNRASRRCFIGSFA